MGSARIVLKNYIHIFREDNTHNGFYKNLRWMENKYGQKLSCQVKGDWRKQGLSEHTAPFDFEDGAPTLQIQTASD